MSLYDKQDFDKQALDRWITREPEDYEDEEFGEEEEAGPASAYRQAANEGATARRQGAMQDANPYEDEWLAKA